MILTNFKWTPRRQRAALTLAEGRTQEDAAIKAGVSQRTIRRWLKNSEFAGEVDRLTLLTGIAQRAARLRITMQIVRQKVAEDNTLQTEKDLLDWLKFAQSESEGAKLAIDAVMRQFEIDVTRLTNEQLAHLAKGGNPLDILLGLDQTQVPE